MGICQTHIVWQRQEDIYHSYTIAGKITGINSHSFWTFTVPTDYSIATQWNTIIMSLFAANLLVQ